MKYLHTMVRVNNLEQSLSFYCDLLGLVETERYESEASKFTLVYLAAPADIAQVSVERSPLLELTYNWDGEVYHGGRNFGHLAYEVDDIYALCEKVLDHNITLNVPPGDGHMAFFRSPDNVSIELLQKGDSLPPCEPWISMQVTGEW
jgi:lactoylglutathione lyase